MKALVTGSNGFIGSHLVEYLLEKGHSVRCLIRKTSNLQWIKHLPVEFVYGDVTNSESLPKVVEGMDYIFHLGGTVRARDEDGFLRVNHRGTKNLLDACIQHNGGIKRFLFASSQAAAGPAVSKTPVKESDEPNPISMYGRSKRVAEREVMEYADRLPVTIVRPPSVYGERDDDILELFKYVNMGVKLLVGKDDKYLSLIHVRDLVRGIYLAVTSDKSIGEIYFLTNMDHYTTDQIETQIAAVLGKKTITIRFPEFLIDFYAFVSESIARLRNSVALVNKDKALEMKQPFWLVDGAKAKAHLGFESEIPFPDGIRSTAEWYNDNGWM